MPALSGPVGRSICAVVVLAGAWFGAAGGALAGEAYVRVVDVGTGLCVIARTPAGQTMVYDTGPPGRRCADAGADVVPNRENRRAAAPADVLGRPVIDLLVLSHSDSDHIGGAAAILDDYQVLQVLHPGDDRPLGPPSNRTVLGKARDAIAQSGATDWSLAAMDIDFGYPIDLGAATATFVAGWHDGHLTEGAGEARLHGGELNNGLSIVIRYEYGGHSVLLTGDTVGRHAGAARGATMPRASVSSGRCDQPMSCFPPGITEPMCIPGQALRSGYSTP